MTTPQSPLHLLQDPSLLKTTGYINGTWVQGPDTFAVTDPATGLELAQVANLTPTHTQQAIDAAETALPAWRSGSRCCSLFLVELGASMMVASTKVPWVIMIRPASD